jgi:DnaJ-class molecular chaperone
MSRTITCPDCRGEGRVLGPSDLDPKRCERCKGHGRLEVLECSHCAGKGYVGVGRPYP